MKAFLTLPQAAFLAFATLFLSGAARAEASFPDPPADDPALAKGTQVVVLAGGCFWGMEGVFERLKGVSDVVSGYSGGDKETAHYEMVSSGSTGHAESIQITYNPSVISFGTILQVFFSVAHDPTELNFQGPDHGTQYRSAIFYMNDAQKRVAQDYIRDIGRAGVFSDPLVTQLVPFKAFYPAEDYHQHFMDKNPDYPYILMWDRPKVAALSREYPLLVARR
jgi:peptide-methionine (S)-S-oxide reductase